MTYLHQIVINILLDLCLNKCLFFNVEMTNFSLGSCRCAPGGEVIVSSRLFGFISCGFS